MNPPSRVLIVEDDELIRSIHRRLVQATPGFVVVGAVGTLAEAEHALAGTAIDLLIVDIGLPDGSGLAWVQRLPRTDSAPDAIMITAARDLKTVQAAVRSGVLDFLVKPFDHARLTAALHRHQRRRTPALPTQLTQHAVDQVLRHEPVTHLPKGIQALTLQSVQLLLEAQTEAISAEAAGQTLGCSRITAWRYLEYLVSLGLAQVEVQYQPTGRPQKLYRAAASAAR